MAYADANQTSRKFGAGATVLALEVGIAWAIIGALGMTITRTIPPRLDTYTVHPEDPKPVPTVTPTTSHPVDPAPTRPDTHVIDLGPTALPTFVPDNTIGTGDGGGIDIVRPTPTPVPVPSFIPKAARPVGNMANWVTTNDYPTIGLRGEHEGSVRYRLSVDTSGKVSGCAVTVTSGFADLDTAACTVLARRAKFTPATDDTGAKIAGSFSGTVTWRLPQD